ncbi:hypothetical protein ACFSE1_13765 [Rhizobium helianthi]|uniref:Holin n=1 Tax=Rhizobium helianthi TaxID=1132695 RepID=A0ABW4M6E8_9HYPH
MDDAKAWYQSKTVWGGLIAIFAALMQARGHAIPFQEQVGLADALTSTASALGGLLAIYGRLTATRAIASVDRNG